MQLFIIVCALITRAFATNLIDTPGATTMTTTPSSSCDAKDPSAGQQMIWVPNCQGFGCNANHEDNDCAWCIYDYDLCFSKYGETCDSVKQAREAQGIYSCGTNPTPPPVPTPAPTATTTTTTPQYIPPPPHPIVDANDLISEWRSSQGIAFTMVGDNGWSTGLWGLVNSQTEYNPIYQTFLSIMTYQQPMKVYKGLAYGLCFHTTDSLGLWKNAEVIGKGDKAGNIVGGPGDGGSHTPGTASFRLSPQSEDLGYDWFLRQKDEILAKYNTVYHNDDYNEFIFNGVPRSALAGIFHYTGASSKTFAPSDGQMCQMVGDGTWPICAYSRTDLTIERYISCGSPKLLTEVIAPAKCNTMDKDFCKTKYASEAFCDPSSNATQQLGDGCSCPWGDKADAGRCTGSAPKSYFCKHNAKSNSCGKCTRDADCGNEKFACWAYKDSACPKKTFFLRSSAAVENELLV